MVKRMRWVVPIAAVAMGLAACSSTSSTPSESESSGVSAEADAALAAMADTVLATGPHGEAPAKASTADLSDAEVAQVKDLHATAAIVMHYSGNDWANAQIDGLKTRFAELGIEVVAVTDANFDAGQQVSDIETVMAKNPDIIVSIPTDPVATASAYKAAADAGVKLVFMDNVPDGLVAGKDYVSVVSADNYGNGVASAHLMAKALGGKGKIGLIYHEADFFVTQQRYAGFKETITKNYPDITIVDEQGIAGPDFAGDAQKVTDAMLTKHSDLDGMWGVWDVPAEGIMAAARSAGRTDLKIATQDLGTNVAIALAQKEMVIGLGAQRPYEQGVTEANLAAGSLIGRTAEPFVALPALPVTHDNVLEAWKTVYNSEAPKALASAFTK